MRHKLGSMIREAREKLDLSREEAAKKVGITPAYLGHLERGTPVHLSDKLLKKLQNKVGLTTRLDSMPERQNARARRYAANRRKAA